MADEVEIKAIHGGRLVEWSGQVSFVEADDATLRSPALDAAYKDGGRRSEIRGAEDDHRKAKAAVRQTIRVTSRDARRYFEVAGGVKTVEELRPRIRGQFESFIRLVESYRHLRFEKFWVYNDAATVAEIEKAIEQLDRRDFVTADELYAFFYDMCRRFRSSVRRYLPTRIV